MAYVYRHIRLDKNEPFYIGIGSDEKYKRAYDYLNRSKYWKRISLKNNYEVEILFDNISWDDAKKKEIEFIALYGRKDLGKGILCNMTDGGEGILGLVHSEQTKKIISEAARNISDETRQKMSINRKGRKMSTESVLKMSLSSIGRKATDETKNKMSLYSNNRSLEHRLKLSKWQIGRERSKDSIQKSAEGNFKKIICIDTNIEYGSINEAAKNLRIDKTSISKVVCGKQKTAGKLSFKLV